MESKYLVLFGPDRETINFSKLTLFPLPSSKQSSAQTKRWSFVSSLPSFCILLLKKLLPFRSVVSCCGAFFRPRIRHSIPDHVAFQSFLVSFRSAITFKFFA